MSSTPCSCWTGFESPGLRQRCQAGLNRSEQQHALAQVICTVKLGRIADCSFEAQQFRASGLNLVIAAIVHWNSTYLADALQHLHTQGKPVPDALLAHMSPLTQPCYPGPELTTLEPDGNQAGITGCPASRAVPPA